MKTKIVLSALLLFAVSCLLSAVSCLAAVPSLINYQGVLKDSLGVPQNGNFSMRFSIYDDSIGGNKLWEEIHMAVEVKHGLFNVLLGSSSDKGLIPDSVFASPNAWLEVQVFGSVLTPRRRIVSVGYAYRASEADTAEYALSAPPDDDWDIDTAGFNIYRLTGNVGIGTPSPQGKLDINGPLAVAGNVGADGQFLKSQGAGTNPVWSEVTAVPADNSVSQAKLKTATGEVSHTGTWDNSKAQIGGAGQDDGDIGFTVTSYTTHITLATWDVGIGQLDATNAVLPGGTYGFYPQIKKSGTSVYAQQRYITSSGKDHWIFFLLDKQTKQSIGGYQAPDHPCHGQGGDENDIPHPFGSYDPDKHEVTLIDNEILPELKAKVTSKRSLLTVINEDYEIDFDSEPVYQPREIIEIDEYGDKEGEILQTIKTPEWAKLLIGKDEIHLKRRLVKTLPSYISYKELKPKSESITESRILSQK